MIFFRENLKLDVMRYESVSSICSDRPAVISHILSGHLTTTHSQAFFSFLFYSHCTSFLLKWHKCQIVNRGLILWLYLLTHRIRLHLQRRISIYIFGQALHIVLSFCLWNVGKLTYQYWLSTYLSMFYVNWRLFFSANVKNLLFTVKMIVEV